MNIQVASSQLANDAKLISLVREVVIAHNDIETILKHHNISSKEWAALQATPRFVKLLEAELVAWNSATNTEERTRLKAAAMIEQWLVEAYRLLHANSEPLSSKTKLAELIAKLGGYGARDSNDSMSGEKFSITINLGADANLTFEKASGQRNVIDVEPVSAQ